MLKTVISRLVQTQACRSLYHSLRNTVLSCNLLFLNWTITS